ncbi:MAG: beta strand repeat-containing protein, partial [Ilumatobacteraceae bacterium]
GDDQASGSDTDTTFAGVSAGTGGLTKAGSGTFTLTGINTYSGTTTLGDSGGTLLIGGAGQLNSGTYGGAISLGSATVFDFASSADQTLSGNITGAGQVKKTVGTTNTLTLSGASSSYSGATTIDKGTVSITTATALGSGDGATTVSSGATLQVAATVNAAEPLNIAGTGASTAGAISFTAAGTLSSTVAMTANSTVQVADGVEATISGVISGSFGFTKANTGTLVISAANTYTSTTTISAGTLKLSGSGSVPDRSAVTVTGTFDLNNVSDTVGSVAGAGTINFGSATLITGDDQASGSDTDTTFSGTMTGSGGFTKKGTGTFTLSGSTSDYTGVTAIDDGVVAISNAAALGASAAGQGTTVGTASTNATLSVAGSLTIDEPLSIRGTGVTVSSATVGAVRVTSGSPTFTAQMTALAAAEIQLETGTNLTITEGITGANTSLTFDTLGAASQTATVGAITTGTGGITKTGSGLLRLSGTNTFTGDISVAASGGVIEVSGEGSLGGLTDGVGTYSGAIALGTSARLQYRSSTSQILSGVISGAGAIRKETSSLSTLTLQGSSDNTYSGLTTVTAGIVEVKKNNALGNDVSAGATVVGSGAAIAISGGVTLAETVQVSGAGIDAGGAIVNQSGNNTITGAITLTNNVEIQSNADTLTFSSGLSQPYNLTFETVNTAAIVVTGGITTGAGTVTKQGAGTVTVNGTSTYSGTTTITAGTLVIGSAGSLGSGTYSATIANDGSFKYSSSTSQTLSGAITGTGSITKDTSNTSTLTLSPATTSSYSGSTTVSNGTLKITENSSLGVSSGGAAYTIVSDGATLEVAGGGSVSTAEPLRIRGTG